MSGKQDLPAGPPPPLYTQHDTASTIGSPAPAHMQPQHTNQSDYYGASPAMGQAQPYGGYPPQGQYYGGPQEGYPPQGYPQSNGYYAPGPHPQMGYQQQQYGPPQGMYYGGQPQGHYVDQRRGPGFCEALLASLACCCCLDLLF